MNKIRFAILGAGGIANQFARAAALVDDAEIVAVASKSSADRAAAFAEHHKIPASYDSYDALLARDDIDVVYIATTHNFHADNIKQCLLAGKHVICEKPMVLTESDARACFALAQEKNLFLMEAMWTRCLPALQKARAWIEAGRIGTLQSANSVIGFRAGNDTNGRLLNPALAGGAMYDIGVYAIEIVSYLMGESVDEVAFMRRDHEITGVDSRVSMILRYPSADACLQCLFTSNPKEYTIINGSHGFIEIPASHSVREAHLFDENRTLIETVSAPFENGFTFEIEEVIRCVREGRCTSKINPHEMTINCAKIFETVLGH